MHGLLEVTPVGLAYICLGGFVVLFSLFSLLVREKVYVNEVVLGTGLGILMGPLCADVFDPRSWATDTNRITLEIMRVVLATSLFAVGVELPKSYMYDHVKGLLALVVPTMTIGWVVVAAILKALFTRFNYTTCLALAACLTPTDPIICAAIVGKNFSMSSLSLYYIDIASRRKHVPINIRHILSAESAGNDGLAYPFLSISLYLTLEPDRRKDIQDWVLIGWLYQVILGILIGGVIGYLFSLVMKFSHQRGFIDRESYVAQYLALSIFTMGVVNTIGSDDLLATFAAGSAISWDGDFNTHTEGEAFASVIEYIFNCGCFFYIVLCIAILFLRRIPAILFLYRWVPEIANWKEALFCGHFGPMGVGAIFISTLALHRLPPPRNPPESQQDILAIALHPVVGFVVLVSIITHGLSIPFFNVGRNIHSHTLTPTSTLITRIRTWGGSIQTPEWLLSVRRSPTSEPQLPFHSPPVEDVPPQMTPHVVTKADSGNAAENSTSVAPDASHATSSSVNLDSGAPSSTLSRATVTGRDHSIAPSLAGKDATSRSGGYGRSFIITPEPAAGSTAVKNPAVRIIGMQ
ncbi:putative Na(+)/H(+) antiporter C3A11.09 [Leucoagaricus sp. SymC.cos]|nr:putative Na(+)/H(+) antiporter C3A11.09 [Leucoagaricus sp. SymC.cos]